MTVNISDSDALTIGLPKNWEADSRPFATCLRAWRDAHGWSWQETADALRKPLGSVQQMAKGRAPGDEPTLRRLMTLIDRLAQES